MAYEQRDNSGSLFKNNKKTQDNHPDYTGSAMVDGKPKRLAAWLKKSQKGLTYMSVSIRDDEERPKPINSAEDGGYEPATSPASNGFDDIPFS